jgi:UDP-2,3-diacylglucosamine pyrophosphatase LpxH
MPNTGSPTPLRTLFLSDLHLGALGARAERILDFLETTPADCYVLVGDVLDLWQPLLPNWSREDQAVVDHLRQRHEDGSRIVYLVGNHDPVPDRAPAGRRLPVAPQAEIVHVAADGRRYLVLHGDVVDSRLVRAHVCTRLGSRIDHALRRMDQLLGALRHRTSGEARTTIGLLIGSVNDILYARRSHERRLVALARARGLDGVICGHFHIAGLHDAHGLIYANCGDWVDSFTAVGERHDGTLCLLAHAVRTEEPQGQPVPVEA